MVWSQVFSQHPSRCLLSAPHQPVSNADMHFLEVETGNRDCNSTADGDLRSLKGCAYSGHAGTSSSIKSSWIQRLIPAHIIRDEQLQFMNSLPVGREAFDGLRADWSNDSIFRSDIGNRPGSSFYENNRRTGHEFSSNKNTTIHKQIGISAPDTSRICKSLEALEPEIQVPPKALPVVESLLNPDCSKHVMETQVSLDTNKPHNLSRCSGFSTPINQTVHFSADERSRVSCSLIERLDARFAAGDLNASLLGNQCFNASQRSLNNHPEPVLRSNMELFLGGTHVQTCTYSGMDLTKRQEAMETNHSESRDRVSTRGLSAMERSYRYEDSRFLDRCSMPDNIRVMDSFLEYFMQENSSTMRPAEDLHVDKNNIQTMDNRSCELSKEHQNYGKGAIFSFENSWGKGGSYTPGGCSKTDLGNDGSQADLISSQFEANALEKTSISLTPLVLEQELGSSRDSYEEQDAMSGSFSFHAKGRLPHGSADTKVAIERGHWPFCETNPYNTHSLQIELPGDQRTRDLVEALRMGSLNNVSSDKFEVDIANVNKSQWSPFLRTEMRTDCQRHGLASKHDVAPHKPPCMDGNGVCAGQLKAEAMCSYGVIQGAGIKQENGRKLNDGIFSSRLQSMSTFKDGQGREYAHPSEAISRAKWESYKPPSKLNTFSVGSIGSCSKQPENFGTQGLATDAEAWNTYNIDKEPIALPSSCSREQFSVGGGLIKALDGPRSGGKGLRSLNGSNLRQNMWLKRWSTGSPREERALLMSKLNRERDFVNSRDFVETYYNSSQSSWESSRHFDLRPAKRTCYGQTLDRHSGPCQAVRLLGSIASAKEKQQGTGVVSHFMKRFLTPSAAAMAVMGMTARKMHATQPQSRGLFGVWPVLSSTNKPLRGLFTDGKELWTGQKNKKEFLHSSAKPASTQVVA